MSQQPTSTPVPSEAALKRMFERKVRRAKLAVVFEQAWRSACLLLGVVGLFLLVSLLGIWPMLSKPLHVALLAMFAAAAGLAVLSLLRIHWPSRDTAIRRIEKTSQVPHRPASSYEDTLSGGGDNDPSTAALWSAHRKRLVQSLKRLRVGKPRPRTDRYDPFALRALLLLFLATALGFVGAGSGDRIRAAFNFGNTYALADARLDAWISPPSYTGRPPLMLADGRTSLGDGNAAHQDDNTTAADPFKAATKLAPVGSTAIVRVGGLGSVPLSVETAAANSNPNDDKNRWTSLKPEKTLATSRDTREYRTKITQDTILRVKVDNNQLADWTVTVIPDKLPTIALVEPPKRTPRGSMKLIYKLADDYGVESANVRLVLAPTEERRKAQEREARRQGFRPRKSGPLEMPLPLPGPTVKEGESTTFLEFGPHPWAGKRVLMTLVAKDVAGQEGQSEGLEIILPERQFTKPLAQAVIEQRRKLMDDPRYRRQVVLALGAITTDPEDIFEDHRAYLSLRSVYHRLRRSRASKVIDSSIEQLWHTALRIEQGDLSDAERRLRDAQDKLSKALQEGASEEEIKKLMEELRQAMNDFMEKMAKQAQDEQRDFTEGQDQNNQQIDKKDIDQMMKNLEDMAKTGARKQAMDMLSQLREMMERMQAGQQNQKQAEQNKQMQKNLSKLKGMVGDQQKLMDDTFQQQKQGGQQPGRQAGRQSSQNQLGSRGQFGQQRRGRDPRRGMGLGPQQRPLGRGAQQGQQGQGQQPGEGQMPSPEELAERQRQLQRELAELQRQMAENGAGQSEELRSAQDSMQQAEEALRGEDYARALQKQSEALQQMRQGSEQMAQDMQGSQPQRYGRKGERRDPLGRPQRSQGPELGTSVKVPDEIELQRAREIIDELRRRRGQVTRPQIELDYLDRLLKRF
jgi:uncharacterized protein (TIGR02302 family)